MVLAADCTAFAVGDFHDRFLQGKRVAIACPKLDSEKEVYLEKLISLIDDAKINTLNVLMMEVPCCGGLLAIAQKAAEQAERKVPLKKTIIGVNGDVLHEEWV